MLRFAWLLSLATVPILGANQLQNIVGPGGDNKNFANYNYGYSIAFDERGSSQGHAQERQGEHTQGNYYVNLPNDESHANVQYIADDFGYHPVVRISTRTGHSQVSSHFALGNSAVKALHEQDSKSGESDLRSPEWRVKQFLLESRKKFESSLHNIADVKEPAESEKVTKRIPLPGISKLVATTYNLVSNEDVININGAAEEYFDDINEERLNEPHKFGNGFSAFNRPIIVEDVDILSNNLPRPTGKSLLDLSQPEVLITPIKENFLNLHEQHASKQINVKILDDYNKGQYLIEKVPSQQSEQSPGYTELPHVNVKSVLSNETLSAGQFESFPPTSTEISSLVTSALNNIQDEQISTAHAISEDFLAPIQAGLLLSNDEKDSNDSKREVVHPEESSKKGYGERKKVGKDVSKKVGRSYVQLTEDSQIISQHLDASSRSKIPQNPGLITQTIPDSQAKSAEPTIYVTENINEVSPIVELLPKPAPNSTDLVNGKPAEVEKVNKINKLPVPDPVTQYVDRIVERPVPYLVPFQTIVNRPYPVEKIIEKYIKVPVEGEKVVEKIVDRPVHIQVPVPVHIPLQTPLNLPYPVAYTLQALNDVNINNFANSPHSPAISSAFEHQENNINLCEENRPNPFYKCHQQSGKIIKDEYFGPVPVTGEYSLWNSVGTRQRRKLNFNSSPRMEYGFKPPLIPSTEIDDQGLPIIRNSE